MSIRDIQCITASGDGVDPALLITLDCRPTVQYLVGAPEGFSRLALEQGVRPGLGLRAAFCHNVCAQLGLGSLIMRLRSDGHGYVHVVGPQGSSAHLGSLSEFISWQFPTVLCTELASGASEEAYEVPRGVVVPESGRPAGMHAARPPHEKVASFAQDEWLNAWSCRRGCDDEMLPAWLREELACASEDEASSSDASSSGASSSSSSDAASTSSAAEGSSSPSSSEHVPGAASASSTPLDSVPRRPSHDRGAAVLSNHQTEGSGDSVTVGGHAYHRPGRREEPQFRVGLFVRQTGQDAFASFSNGAIRASEAAGASTRASNRRHLFPPPPCAPPLSPQRPPSVLLYVLFLRASRQVLLAAHAESEEECSALEQLPVLRALKRARVEVALAAVSVPGSLVDSEALRGLRRSLPRAPVVLLPRGADGGGSEPRLGHRQSLKACIRLHACCPPLFQLPHGLSSAGQRSPAEGALGEQAEPLRCSASHPPSPPPIWTTTTLVPTPDAAEPGWTLRPMHAEAPQALVCRVLEECRAELEESVRQRLLQRLPPLVQQACIGPRILENAPPCSSASPPPALQPDSNRRAAVRLREELLSRKRAKCANGGGPVPSSPAASVGSPLEPCFSDPDVDAETALGAGGARLLFLGTGSAEPSSHRGPSAILVQTSDPRASFLLDCGEGTAGALVRWLGPSGARAAALALSLVWISHRHADHMSGLPGLLRLRNVGEAAPLVVVGPLSLWRWLRGSASAQGVRFVPASAFACGDASRGCESSTAPASRWRTISSARAWDVASPPSLLPHAPFLLHAEPMQHCPDAWACVVRHVGSGWALAYSGDGTPSRRLARACRGCALLVHEATFEDDRAGDAAKKRHSTVSQALGVGQEAGVPAVVLTHFSQRYPRFPRGVLEAGEAAGGLPAPPSPSQSRRCVGVAFDGMVLPLAALPFLPDLMRAVQTAVPGEGLPEARESFEKQAS